jgi:hypothetical protein
VPSSEVSNFSNITMRSVDPMPRTTAPSYGREARTYSRPNWAATPLKQLTTSSAGSVSGLRRSQSSSISCQLKGWSSDVVIASDCTHCGSTTILSRLGG